MRLIFKFKDGTIVHFNGNQLGDNTRLIDSLLKGEARDATITINQGNKPIEKKYSDLYALEVIVDA